ncbi:MAG: hypothetical protein KME23_16945 [Goleter apudmare HA4340-LM2]|jgi:hypothetical protein|nr:hypothetical protein [Goleter apudmare HA4340-LM2]
MQIFFLFSSVFLLSLTTGDIHKKLVNNYSANMVTQINTESPDIKVIKITLLAREENTPPIGEVSQPNRDIGFASVFIRLVNLKESDSKITIQNIKIVSIDDGKSQNFSFSPQELVLRPLENAEHVFHLKNKTGYLGKDAVKAIVTYKVGNLDGEIRSDFIQLTRP